MGLTEQEYISEVLKVDSFDFDELFKLRSQYLSRKSTELELSERELEKNKALQKIEVLSKQYWDLKPEIRTAEIESLQSIVEMFPELAKKINDFVQNDKDIEYLQKLKNVKKYDPRFLQRLIHLVPLSLKDKSDAKDKLYEEFLSAKKLKILKTLKFIKKDNPSFYNKNQSFFTKLFEYKYAKTEKENEEESSLWAVVGFFFIFFWCLKACI